MSKHKTASPRSFVKKPKKPRERNFIGGTFQVVKAIDSALRVIDLAWRYGREYISEILDKIP
jgi:hypothetical protein